MLYRDHTRPTQTWIAGLHDYPLAQDFYIRARQYYDSHARQDGNVVELLYDDVENDNLEEVNQLLQEGVDPYSNSSSHAMSPFDLAVTRDDKEILAMMLQSKNTPSIFKMMRNRDLREHILLEFVLTEMVKLGHNINALDPNGNTIIDYAGNNREISLVTKLGYQVSLEDIAKATLAKKSTLERIYRQQHQSPVQQLADGLRNNDESEVLNALARGADPNAIDNNESMLKIAIDSGNVDMITRLANAKVNINNVGRPWNSSLDYAISIKSLPGVTELIDLGANVNLGAPLMRAIKESSSRIASRLIDAGANVNIADHLGKTLLSYAYVNTPKLIPDILAHGVTITQEDVASAPLGPIRAMVEQQYRSQGARVAPTVVRTATDIKLPMIKPPAPYDVSAFRPKK
jgi:ankyrin repeat protein